MSEEEKKAVEMLKDRQKELLEYGETCFYSSDRKLYKEHAEAIDIILHLIERLQKEIKDITSIPNDDIEYDEEGNEL